MPAARHTKRRGKVGDGFHSLAGDLSLLRQLARIGNNPVGMKRIWNPVADAKEMPNVSMLAAALETVSKRKLADAVALNGISEDPLGEAASRSEMPLRLDWRGGSADKLARALLRYSPASVYCQDNLSAGEREALARSGSTGVFSAGGALLDSQPGNCIRDLVEVGGAIALGSGYDALNEPNFNMQLVLALAVRRLNLTIEQAIVATTINAAYAMDCGDEIGSLEPGKRAEVLVLNLSDYRELPRRLGVNHVAMAIRDGNLVINRTRWRVGAA